MRAQAPGARFRREWVLNQNSLGKLLASLDSDRGRAAEKYEVLRRKLVKFFQWHGTVIPEEHADETINRVSRRLDEGEQVQNVSSYAYGVGRMLLKEIEKQTIRERSAFADYGVLEAKGQGNEETSEAIDSQRFCFDRCLREIQVDYQVLILKYYEGEKQAKIQARKALAEELAISADALRIRAHRIRARLESCVEDCLEETSAKRD